MAPMILEKTKLQMGDSLAKSVVDIWSQYNLYRQSWLELGLDARRYVSATSTATTEVGSLPWKNRTTIPKITQIADNLFSYYMAAFIPSDDWFTFEGSNETARQKAQLMKEYMGLKIKASGFVDELAKIVRDWVIYGNAFGGVSWVNDVYTNDAGKRIVNYIGPRLYRISPLDCLINARAKSFNKSFFIKRDLTHIAEVVSEYSDTSPTALEGEDITARMRELRSTPYEDLVDIYKDIALEFDGFDTPQEYLSSGMVEIIEYWGDIYDTETQEVLKNQYIVIADRMFVLKQEANPSTTGRKPFAHAGWRILPDNLYGQGPLDQLIGMQYRCDHLENLKADAFDLIVHPMIKIIGDNVEDFEFGPNQRIHCGAEGNVEFLRPDTTVLTANNEIGFYHNMMEQMAGSPRETMGFRTPGEKTAFEVNVLSQNADRLFIDKVTHFENTFIEPILNIFYNLIVRRLDPEDVVRTMEDPVKAEQLLNLTENDAATNGVIVPLGAKHFAARNKRMQELSNMLQIINSSPALATHISGLRTAKMLEEELGFTKWKLVEQNVSITEQLQAQAQAQALMQALRLQQQAPATNGGTK